MIDEQLYLPVKWINAPARCQSAGIPADKQIFKTKPEQALEMVCHAKARGIRYQWINCDGFYGEDPAFLRCLNDRGETFMADVYKDQRFYLEDLKPAVPMHKSSRGKVPCQLQAWSLPLRVDELVKHQPPDWGIFCQNAT